jgi:hypothetical protein
MHTIYPTHYKIPYSRPYKCHGVPICALIGNAPDLYCEVPGLSPSWGIGYPDVFSYSPSTPWWNIQGLLLSSYLTVRRYVV